MSLKTKIAAYVERYGYNLRAFAVCGLVFPPAAVFIAWKHPTWSALQRTLALFALVLFLALIPFVGASVASFVARAVKS